MVRSILGTVVAIGLAGLGAFGQDKDAKLTFEVASIKPSAPPDGRGMRVWMTGGPETPDPGRWTTENFSLASLVTLAYNLKRYEYSGPSWMDTERFDIVAKVPLGATKEQFRVMLQNLLVERFKLTFHNEKKEMQVYELMVAKNGPKLKESVEEPPSAEAAKAGGPDAGALGAPPPPPPPPPGGVMPRITMDKEGFPVLPGGMAGRGPMTIMMNGRARTQAFRQSSQQIADMLSNQIGKPVTDATGLKGKYDFKLQWAADSMGRMPPPPPGAEGGAPSPPEDSGPTIYAAIQDQLGLKLEQKKGQVEMLVVDHAEKVPTEN
jgi:uncharacterized protein (TIGR03435 family)